MKLPVCPVTGSSISVPIVDADRAPVSTVVDETYKIAIARLGDRNCVRGTAATSFFANILRARRRETLTLSVVDLFGGAPDLSKATYWNCLGPKTPVGTLVLCATSLSILRLNAVSGTIGRTMSTGSTGVLAALISGRAAEINTSDPGIALCSHRMASS